MHCTPRPASLPLLAALALAGCASHGADHLLVDAPRAQRFEGIGPYARPITTASAEAQRWFDQGLAWTYSFNHDEAIRSFARAATLDPTAAMPWWGIALCEGPNYNDPVMTDERSAAAWDALQEALARIDGASPAERALIEALATRYAAPWPADRAALDRAYADAMGAVAVRFPDDPDVAVLHAEALMVLNPWKLYDHSGRPQGDTPAIVAALERSLALEPDHPGANHLYVHALEASAEPGRAEAAADRLRTLVPMSGHMAHMPTHIDVRIGRWEDAIAWNARALEIDAAYRARSPDPGLQHMYMTHNAHMLAYAAMMVGREREAMAAARAMWANVPEEALEAFAPYVDLWMCSVYDVQKRFGRWDDLLAEPAPPAYLPITTAVWRAHRAVALAAKGDVDGAEREAAAFRAAKAAIPPDSTFAQDSTHRILAVSEEFVAGEIALARGDLDAAVRHLEEAVAREDALTYGEPPQWLQPVRHALGAVLLAAGDPEGAERVYRDDLAHWPRNGWSLYGLARALELQGKDAEAAAARAAYERAWAQADEPTGSSCRCVPET